MKKVFFSAFAFLFILIGCEKEEDNPVMQGTQNPPNSIGDYVKIDSVGNSWVYAHSRMDSNNTVLDSWVDSISVARDTAINGISYKYVPGYIIHENSNLLRDSSGFLVNSNGERLLKVNNLPDTIDIATSPQWDRVKISEVVPGGITTPAGTFPDVIKTTVYFYLQPPMNPSFNPVIFEMYFAKDVGLIREKYSYAASQVFGEHFQRELTAYSVQ